MPDPATLYREAIMAHARAPRNLGPLADATHQARGDNPLCGDRVTVRARLGEDGVVAAVAFEGAGCALCMAAASVMTQVTARQTPAAVAALAARFDALVRGGDDGAAAEFGGALPGELGIFGVMSGFPSRYKCVSLPWQTLLAALAGGGAGATVTTE